MVTKLTQSDRDEIALAVSEAERRTAAEIVVIIAPVSDAYQSYLLVFGLIAGSSLAVMLWATKLLTAFPFLLAIQIAAVAIVSFVPNLRSYFMCLIPEKVLRQRVAHRAYEEYLNTARCVPSTTPIALLYLSLAERYAHIQASRQVREKIDETKWSEVVTDFTTSIGKNGLKVSVTNSVRKMADLLSVPFPDRGEPNVIPGLVEIKI